MKTNNKKGFMTRQEVLEYLGISVNTFYEHFAKELPGYVIGKRIKYKLEDVNNAVKRI